MSNSNPSSQAPPNSEALLVARLKAREQQAFGELYDNYSGALYGVILRIAGTQEATKDILQSVFVKVWKNIERYDAGKGRLYTWLLNIARNAAIDHQRRQSVQPLNYAKDIELSVGEIDRSLQGHIPVDAIGVRELVGKLEREHRDIIELSYFGGLSQREISETLDIPLGTVKTRARIAMRQLRQLLNL